VHINAEVNRADPDITLFVASSAIDSVSVSPGTSDITPLRILLIIAFLQHT
jgi:hypothetical protein